MKFYWASVLTVVGLTLVNNCHALSDNIPGVLSEDEKSWVEKEFVKWESDESVKHVIHCKTSSPEEKGTSYGMESVRVEMEVNYNNGNGGNESVILVRWPGSVNRQQMINRSGLFDVEINFFKHVAPVLKSLLSEFKDKSELPWADAGRFKDDSSAFLLKDIEFYSGYKRGDRRTGLNLEQCKLALATLGKFHALTAVVDDRTVLRRSLFNFSLLQKNWASLKDFQKNVFTNFARSIDINWGSEWSHVADKIRKRSETIGEEVLNLYSRNEFSFNVLNHGSFNVKKVLFTYGITDVYNSPDPIAAKIVSFQMAFYNSPAFDLQFFINTSPNIEIMLKNREELLKAYYSSLEKFLKKFGYRSQIPTYKDISDEVERTELVGLTDAINQLSALYLTPDEVEKMENNIENNSKTRDPEKQKLFDSGMNSVTYVNNMKRIITRALEKNII